MKAVQLHGYGDVDQLHYEDVPDPVAADDQVLVKVAGIGINPVDYKIREGMMKDRMPMKFPAIPGRDISGTVASVGAKVTNLKAGDPVLALVNSAYAELVADKASAFSSVPKGLDLVDAAALPMVVTTGAQLIEKGVKPKSGERVLITGALGSVGRTAVYVARQHGAHVIVGVRGKERGEAEALGAEQVIAVDDENAVKALAEVDAIADTVGGELILKLIPKLKKSGVLASVVGLPESAPKAGFRFEMVLMEPDGKRLEELASDIAQGKFKIPVNKRMKLSEVREAQTLVQKGGAGKVILTP